MTWNCAQLVRNDAEVGERCVRPRKTVMPVDVAGSDVIVDGDLGPDRADA